MAETVNQEQNTEPEKTFTQAELDAIVGDRLKRERAKYADYSELKTKAEEYDRQQEKSEALQNELNAMKRQNAITQAREKVSKDTGVPVECLSGEDEDTCKAQAEAILKFAKPKGYPGVGKDMPKKHNSGSENDDILRDFAQQLFNK